MKKTNRMGRDFDDDLGDRRGRRRGRDNVMTPEEHERFLMEAGIGLEEDYVEEVDSGAGLDLLPIDVSVITWGFIDFCVAEGWLVVEGSGREARYYLSGDGEKELKKFGIKLGKT